MLLENKIRRFIPLLFFITLFASLSSCVNYDEIEIQEIKSVKLLDFSEKGAVVESKVKISNPNNFGVSIVDSDLKFSLKDMKIGTTKIKNKLKLKSNSSQYYTLQLESNFEDMGDAYLGKLFNIATSNNKAVNFEFHGHIVGKVFLLKHNVDIDYKGKVPLSL